jgi:hypothetical protein
MESNQSGISELVIGEDEDDYFEDGDYEGDSGPESESDLNDDINDSSWDTDNDKNSPSIISDPARATPMQRRWLSAMSEGKDPYVAKRFEQ